jgi:hypothetical protein
VAVKTSQSASPLRAIATATILLSGMATGLAMSGQAAAASQGSWGPTSTATAKITLRILPKEGPGSSRSTSVGHDALRSFCASSAGFRDSSHLFTASASNTLVASSTMASTHVDGALRATCGEPGIARVSMASGAELSSEQLTVFIAPI